MAMMCSVARVYNLSMAHYFLRVLLAGLFVQLSLQSVCLCVCVCVHIEYVLPHVDASKQTYMHAHNHSHTRDSG